jgi:centromeric protein E
MYCLMMPKLEAGQVKLQSRLEEEEDAKAALMGRIQRLTKLILVSTKNAMPSSIPERPGQRRRHSFGEDEVCNLAILSSVCVTIGFLMVQICR